MKKLTTLVLSLLLIAGFVFGAGESEATSESFGPGEVEVLHYWTSGGEAAANKIQAAGLIPVAWGGQNWQETTVFEIIVAGIGGTDFYQQTMVDADVSALKSATMVEVFETLRMVLSFTDPGSPNRDWNLATSMVINGEAAMQFMGDWALGEFVAAGSEHGTDYVAVAAPQTADKFLFNVDSFIMFDIDPANIGAQKDMARLILEPEFQTAFNVSKGSIPVRLGMSEEPYAAPQRLSMKDFVSTADSGDLVPSMAHGMAVMPDIQGALYDVVSNFCNSNISAQDAWL